MGGAGGGGVSFVNALVVSSRPLYTPLFLKRSEPCRVVPGKAMRVPHEAVTFCVLPAIETKASCSIEAEKKVAWSSREPVRPTEKTPRPNNQSVSIALWSLTLLYPAVKSKMPTCVQSLVHPLQKIKDPPSQYQAVGRPHKTQENGVSSDTSVYHVPILAYPSTLSHIHGSPLYLRLSAQHMT